MTIVILFGVFAALLLIGMPIAFAIGIASAVAAINIFVIDNVTIVQRMLIGINSFPLLAVIFFVFTGVLMARGGVALRLVRLSEVVVGRLPGGLAQITVLSSMLFGGVSGSAVAEVSSIGATLIPAMEKAGYTKRYATAVVLTSATMGPIIPPSIPMILYAYVVGSVSVAGLFLAGVVPGVLIGIGLLIACYVHGRLYHHQAAPPMSGRDKILRVVDGIASLMTLVIILGGITSGIFTATEAGAVGSVYRWQGAVARADEILVILKTTEARVASVVARIRELHTYDVPEILFLPVSAGYEAYIQWVRDSVKLPQDTEV